MFHQRVLRMLLISALLMLGAFQSNAQVFAQAEAQVRITQVDTSNFPNVTVYVSVANAAGEPVGVDPASIQIQENGQSMSPIAVEGGGVAVGGEAIPVNTMLVIDISGSMEKGNKIGAAKEAARTYINGMRSGDQAGLIAYDTQVYTVQPVTADINALTSAIDGLQTGSDTAMYDALVQAETALGGLSGRKAIIVLTDGMDNQSSNTAENVLAGINESGLTISAIGIGDVNASGQAGLDEAGLRALSERAGGQYAFATDAGTLSALYQQYGQSLQSEYAITYISPATLRDGINRSLTVSLAETGIVRQGEYNPGGVLPEVSGRSWSLFGSLLATLLVLLVLPGLFNRGVQAFAQAKPGKSRIKLDKPPRQNQKPRIKLK